MQRESEELGSAAAGHSSSMKGRAAPKASIRTHIGSSHMLSIYINIYIPIIEVGLGLE